MDPILPLGRERGPGHTLGHTARSSDVWVVSPGAAGPSGHPIGELSAHTRWKSAWTSRRAGDAAQRGREPSPGAQRFGALSCRERSMDMRG